MTLNNLKKLPVFAAMVLMTVLSLVAAAVLPAFSVSAAEQDAEATIPVRIAIEANAPAEAETYAVILAADDTAYPMPAASADGRYTLQLTGEGTGELSIPCADAEAGVYTYLIYQEAGSAQDAAYDDTQYQLTVYVTDETGSRIVTTVVRDAASLEKPDEVCFTNKYPASQPEDPKPDDPKPDDPKPDNPKPDAPKPDDPKPDDPKPDAPKPENPKPDTSTTGGTTTGSTGRAVSSGVSSAGVAGVRTGDAFHPVLWITVLAAAGIAAGVLVRVRRRH